MTMEPIKLGSFFRGKSPEEVQKSLEQGNDIHTSTRNNQSLFPLGENVTYGEITNTDSPLNLLYNYVEDIENKYSDSKFEAFGSTYSLNDNKGIDNLILDLYNAAQADAEENGGLELSYEEFCNKFNADNYLTEDQTKMQFELARQIMQAAGGSHPNGAVRYDEEAITNQHPTLESQNEQLQADNAQLHTDNAELHADLEAMAANNAQLQADLASAQADNASLQADNASLQADNVALQADNVALQADNVALQADNAQLYAVNTELHADLQAMTADNAQLQADLAVTQAELTATQADLTEAQADLAVEQATNAQLNTENENLINNMTVLQMVNMGYFNTMDEAIEYAWQKSDKDSDTQLNKEEYFELARQLRTTDTISSIDELMNNHNGKTYETYDGDTKRGEWIAWACDWKEYNDKTIMDDDNLTREELPQSLKLLAELSEYFDENGNFKGR